MRSEERDRLSLGKSENRPSSTRTSLRGRTRLFEKGLGGPLAGRGYAYQEPFESLIAAAVVVQLDLPPVRPVGWGKSDGRLYRSIEMVM